MFSYQYTRLKLVILWSFINNAGYIFNMFSVTEVQNWGCGHCVSCSLVSQAFIKFAVICRWGFVDVCNI